MYYNNLVTADTVFGHVIGRDAYLDQSNVQELSQAVQHISPLCGM